MDKKGLSKSGASHSIIGIDLGGTKIAGVLLSPKDIILARAYDKVPANIDKKGLVRVITEVIKKLSKKRARIDIVGIGVPGPLEDEGMVLSPILNLPKVGRIPLRKLVEDVIGCPVILENDADCFALGECIFGLGKGKKIVGGITLGTGLGFGTIISGQIYRGSHWAAGEVCSLPLEDGHVLEDYLSGRYFTQSLGTSTVQEAVQRARIGDQRAVDAWHLFGQKLAWLLTMAGLLIDPDMFVLGGSLSCAYDLFGVPLKEVSSQWPVYVSSNPEEMATRGAAFMARKSIEKMPPLR